MSAPTLLIVLLNYRTAQMTLKAAEAVMVDLLGLKGELVIVDNDSQDGSYAALKEGIAARGWDADGRVHLRASERNGGFGAGCNIAIRGSATGLRLTTCIF